MRFFASLLLALSASSLIVSAATPLFEVPVERVANRSDSGWTTVRGVITPDDARAG